jgi:hypothetical protein
LGGAPAFPHVDFGATAFKGDFVHRQLHQVDAAPVLSLEIFRSEGIKNCIRIKPSPLVPDDNGQSLSQLTSTANLNQLMCVHPIAVNDRVVDSFPKRQFDCGFLAGNAPRSFDQSHQAVHKRRDSFGLTRYPSVNFEQGTARMSPGKLRSQA